MPRIVSGVQDRQDPGLAYLAGRVRGRQSQAEALAEQRRQMGLMVDLQNALVRMQKAKADAVEQANLAAQMGDMNAMRSIAQLAKAGSLDPEQSMLESMIQMRQSVTNPQALRALDSSIASYTSSLQANKERKAAEESIRRAGANGLADQEVYMQRLQAGESPQALVQELQKAEVQRNVQGLATQKATGVLAQAEGLLKATPEGNHKLAASYLLEEFKNSPADQATPGKDAEFLRRFRTALIETPDEQQEREFQMRMKRQKQLGSAAPAPGLGGMTTGERTAQLKKEPTLGFGGPKVPQLQGVGTHATIKRLQSGELKPTGTPQKQTQDLSQTISALMEQAKTPEDLVRAIKAQGLALTPEIQAITRDLLQRRKLSAAQAGAADR